MFLTEAATAVRVVWDVERWRVFAGTVVVEITASSFGGDERERKNPKIDFTFESLSLLDLADCPGAARLVVGGGSCEPLDTERAIEDGVFSSSCSDGEEGRLSWALGGAGVDGCPETATRANCGSETLRLWDTEAGAPGVREDVGCVWLRTGCAGGAEVAKPDFESIDGAGA